MSELTPQHLDHFVGRTLGAYHIQRAIGIGAFAFVYLAVDAKGQRVAIKILYASSAEAQTRFAREAKIMKALPASEHVVRLIEIGRTEEGYPYIVMEYVEGITLGEGLKRKPSLEAVKACEFMIQLCEAFSGLHKHGLVHRDIKPANIMIDRQNRIKLIDFGLVKDAQGLLKLLEEIDVLQGQEFSEEVEHGMLVGTPEYLAPEQMSDVYLKDVDGHNTDTYSDVYSLGLIFYQLLSGIVPFPFREDPRKRGYQKKLMAYIKKRISKSGLKLPELNQIDPDLEAVVFSALRHDPRERPKDAMMFRDRIQAYLDEDYDVDDEATAVVAMDDIVKDLDRWTAKQRDGFFGEIEEAPLVLTDDEYESTRDDDPPLAPAVAPPGMPIERRPGETTLPPATVQALTDEEPVTRPGDSAESLSSLDDTVMEPRKKSLPKYLAPKPPMPRHTKVTAPEAAPAADSAPAAPAGPAAKMPVEQVIGRPLEKSTPAWLWLAIGAVLALIILCVLVIVFQR